MTDFSLNKKFDIVFVGYNSVHHILNHSDFIKFMSCVKKHLKPRGRFYFDIFNPSLIFLSRPQVRSEMSNFIDPVTGEHIMRCCFPQEMDALLGYNGFRIVKKYGSFNRESFAGNSPKQIYKCILSEL